MKLNKNVGRGCFPDAASVLAVQTALANIRNKQYRPYYAGKRDGKQGPEFFCAIEAFQMDEYLPVTGKIETAGPCFNRLRAKVPLHVKNQLSGTGTGHGATTPTLATGEQSVASRVKQIAMQSSLAAGTHAPLPHREATALAKFIRQAGERGCPLLVRAYDIDSEGRFTVQMQIEAVALPTGPERAGIVKGLAEDLAGAIRQTPGWKVKDGPRLAYATERKWAVLAAAQEPTRAFLQDIGLGPNALNPVQKRLAGAAEKTLFDEGISEFGRKAVLEVLAEALTNTGMGGESGNKLAAFLKDGPKNRTSFRGIPLHPASSLSTSQQGVEFLKRVEGLPDPDEKGRYPMYDDNDTPPNCTVGYGRKVHDGPCTFAQAPVHPKEKPFLDGITKSEAEELLRKDIQEREPQLQALIEGARVTRPMYDALMSFYFNAGGGRDWELYTAVREGDYIRAAQEMDVITSGGSFNRGLANRRKREIRLFLTGEY